MWGILLLLLAAWIAISVIGLVIKGLFWLFIIGVVLFLATSALGATKKKN